MYFENQVVLITGASGGIGEALAYEFAKQNAILLLCARNEKELQRVKNTIVSTSEIFVCDITNYEQVDKMMATIMARYGKVDVLVNNAGVSQRSLAAETKFSVDEQIMNLNYFGTVYITKKVLPFMIKAHRGHIIVISSVAGKYGFWQRSAYAASKHALHGFFETLQIELKEHQIQTLLVCPGGVQTNISINALTADGTKNGAEDLIQEKGITPLRLAQRILIASQKGKKQLLVGKGEVYLYWIKKWFPWLFFKIVERVKGR